jgi:hypothetical protein
VIVQDYLAFDRVGSFLFCAEFKIFDDPALEPYSNMSRLSSNDSRNSWMISPSSREVEVVVGK